MSRELGTLAEDFRFLYRSFHRLHRADMELCPAVNIQRAYRPDQPSAASEVPTLQRRPRGINSLGWVRRFLEVCQGRFETLRFRGCLLTFASESVALALRTMT